MLKFFLLLALSIALHTAPVLSAPAETQRDVRQVEIPTAEGTKIKPLGGKDQKAVVLFFIAHECPISNQYAPEVKRVVEAYAPKKVAFHIVYVEPDLTAAQARKHAESFGYPRPALLDQKQELAHLAGATITPEVAVFTPDGKRRYLGRIDNRYASLGKRRKLVTTHDLRDALDAILSGKPIAQPVTTAFGCYISDFAAAK